jgi:hypothetical protein
MLEIDLDWSEFPDRRLFANAATDMTFATALALTDVAKRGKRNVEGAVRGRLDRPRAFTERGLFVRPADRKGRLEAEVGFKLIQEGYLDLVEAGGVRVPEAGRRAVMTPVGVRLNRYGNLPRGYVKRMENNRRVFGGTVGGVKGLWMRPAKRRSGTTDKLKLLVRYDERSKQSYRPILGFEEVIRRTVGRHLGPTWHRRVAEAFARRAGRSL